MSSSSSSRLEPSVLRLRGGSAGVVSLSETHELDAVFARHQALVVVEFTASWCRPCQAIAPQYEALAVEEAYSNVVFVKVGCCSVINSLLCNQSSLRHSIVNASPSLPRWMLTMRSISATILMSRAHPRSSSSKKVTKLVTACHCCLTYASYPM